MKKLLAKLLLCIIPFASMTWGQSSLDDNFQISINLQPRATYYISELYDAVVNNQELPHMVSMTLHNNSVAAEDLKVRLIIHSELLGQNIFDGTTVAFEGGFPITLEANESREIKNTDFDLESTSQLYSRLDKNAIIEKFKASHSPEGDQLDIPATDTYTYTAYLFRKNSSDNPENAIATATDVVQDFQEFGNLELISPPDQQNYAIGFLPTFSWSGVNVRTSKTSGEQLVNAIYTVKIWKGVDGNEDDANLASTYQPIFNRTFTNETQFTYTPNDEPLLPDTTYHWRVTVKDDKNLPIGNGKSLTFYSFNIDPVPPAELLGPEGRFTGQPFFQWTTVPQADRYEVEISDDASFLRRTIIEVDGTQTSVSAGDSILFEPGRSYVWRVQAYNSLQEKWGNASEANVISLDERISYAAPQNEEIVAQYPIFFIWSSITGAQEYVLEISKDNSFAQPMRFYSAFTQLSFDGTQSELDPSQTYFWRVRPLGQNGMSWGEIEADVQKFTTNFVVSSATIVNTDTFYTDETNLLFDNSQVLDSDDPMDTETELMNDSSDTIVADIEEALNGAELSDEFSNVDINDLINNPENYTELLDKVAQKASPDASVKLAPEEISNQEKELNETDPASQADVKKLADYIVENNKALDGWVMTRAQIKGLDTILYKKEIEEILNGTKDIEITIKGVIQ